MFPIIGEVVIRTNIFATTVSINAPSDIVNRYGYTSEADAIVDSDSYHEFGIVGRLEIKQGHFVAEPTAEVFCLMDTREEKSNEDEAPTIKEGAKVYAGDTASPKYWVIADDGKATLAGQL